MQRYKSFQIRQSRLNENKGNISNVVPAEGTYSPPSATKRHLCVSLPVLYLGSEYLYPRGVWGHFVYKCTLYIALGQLALFSLLLECGEEADSVLGVGNDGVDGGRGGGQTIL